MSSLGGMLGLSGGAAGTGFAGPSGVDPAQLTNAYNQTQQGIQQQQAFVNALAQQNGLGNQSAVFQQQQGLANQLQGVANGTGPNPALAQLNQATANNTANQAALMAGQRGASQNVGMIARQAAQQGAANQQQAVGQGATLQAQQQLAGMQQLQGQQANMGNLANTQVAQQQTGLQNLNQNSLQQQSNLMGLQSNINSANTSLAGNAQNQQSNMLGNIMGGAGAAMMLMAGGGEVSPQAGSYGQIDPNNDPFKTPPTALTAPQVAPTPDIAPTPTTPSKGPMSNVAQYFSNNKTPSAAPNIGSQNYFSSGQAGKDFGAGLSHLFSSKPTDASSVGGTNVYNQTPAQQESDRLNADLTLGDKNKTVTTSDNDQQMPFQAAHGGKVPTLVSPGEIRIKAKDVPKVAKGQKSPLDGEKIPGKPKVGGAKNSYANDIIPKTLNEGDIILPRSVTQSKHPQWAAHKFVSSILAKNRHGKK